MGLIKPSNIRKYYILVYTTIEQKKQKFTLKRKHVQNYRTTIMVYQRMQTIGPSEIKLEGTWILHQNIFKYQEIYTYIR